jgi:isopentenyl diphosphate isomerase/L-lactate dehydrogenase-like FMN-dependent dehydrogenase
MISSSSKNPFSQKQMAIYEAAMRGSKPPYPLAVEDLEAEARRVLPPKVYHYVAGGAGGEETMRANLAAFKRWAIVPRMMRDVSQRDYRVNLFGTELTAPLILAPIGQLGSVHANGDAEAGRAAASMGLSFILSTVSSAPLESVATAMGTGARWFHLYWPNDPQLAHSFLQRAQAAGYTAVVVTLDTRLMGWRERDLREGYLPFASGEGLANYFSDPVFRQRLKSSPEQDPAAAFFEMLRVFADLKQTWESLEGLRSLTKLPILLKGILHPDDAKNAVRAGIDGIIVSNHGGRQVDGAIAALQALPAVVTAVENRIPVLFDSGIRRGSDMIKALALGARAVLLGRPYVWGLAVGGEAGVRAVLENLLADFDLTMSLAGYTNQNQLNAEQLLPCVST